jgi:hypothetical protein
MGRPLVNICGGRGLSTRWRARPPKASSGPGARRGSPQRPARLPRPMRGWTRCGASCWSAAALPKRRAAPGSAAGEDRGATGEGAGELMAALAGACAGAGEELAAEMAALARLAAERPKAFYGPSLRFGWLLRHEAPGCPGRPRLLRPTRQLADRLLRGRGELEDPIGAAVNLYGQTIVGRRLPPLSPPTPLRGARRVTAGGGAERRAPWPSGTSGGRRGVARPPSSAAVVVDLPMVRRYLT